MTRTFTKVNRQYGQVMVGTDTAMMASLSLRGSAGEGHPSGGAVHREPEAPARTSGQPRSVTVVLGLRAAVEAFTNLPVMALR